MVERIGAILFDVGDTLRRSHENPQSRMKLVGQIIELAESRLTPEEMNDLLTQRWQAYKQWCERTLIEVSEEALWSEWMMPDYPKALVETQAVRLNALWRKSRGDRVVLPDAADVLCELFRRGYRLGVISNTLSRTDGPAMLEKLGVLDYFEIIQLSTVFGKRKPDPTIFLAAAQAMAVRPEHCAFVGNRIDFDVAGSLRAGFGQAIMLADPRKPVQMPDDPTLQPDYVIDNLKELLDIFPPPVLYRRPVAGESGHAPKWGSSISSMWMINSGKSMDDFLRAGQEIGFAGIELNHETSLEILQAAHLDGYTFTSVHEPCPSDIAKNTYIERDWLVSSTDGECRRQGVRMMKRSINLAQELGASVVVLHLGAASQEKTMEVELRRLYSAGQQKSLEYAAVLAQMVEKRAAIVEPYFEAVKQSLKELAEYSGKAGVRLAIENRYHYFEIPQPDELELLLDMFDDTQVGFLYDVGHAFALERLGFCSQDEWLNRFSERIMGVHLHDVIGLQDHYAPGMGEVDFGALAKRLPAQALRTCELKNVNTLEQVLAGVEVLAGAGIIHRL